MRLSALNSIAQSEILNPANGVRIPTLSRDHRFWFFQTLSGAGFIENRH